MLANALQYSHELLKAVVKSGDSVVDATMGNGHDTLFLADLVGESGNVYSFDIQDLALNHTTDLLNQNGTYPQVNLIQASHAELKKYVNQEITGIIFNLGYLPGGDKTVITHSESTITAIQNGLDLLKNKGRMVLVCYYGHPGGQTELQEVLNFVQQLPQVEFNVLQYDFINQINFPPKLICIERKKPNSKKI